MQNIFGFLHVNLMDYLKEETVKYIGMFPEEEERPWIHRAVVKYKDKLFFCPFYSQKISVYDIREKTFECYSISELDALQCRYGGAGRYEEFLFFGAIYLRRLFALIWKKGNMNTSN